MKLSRTGWNNIIIFSVMIFILLINVTNKKLFSEDENQASSAQFILPEHSVILSLSIQLSDNKHLLFERLGRRWQMTAKGLVVDFSQQQIQQLILSWQEHSGLVQASDVVVEGKAGVPVTIVLADIEREQQFFLYALSDQLLVYNQQSQLWLALPAAIAKQLLPM
jgi:hypothetical protein